MIDIGPHCTLNMESTLMILEILPTLFSFHYNVS
nr:MAG TPA: hypothetical protein [Caudoviricetes sp.]